MCFSAVKQKTIEEIIAENSIGMTDAQKAQYWYELKQTTFALLGKVEVPIYPIQIHEWIEIALVHYPTLTDIKIADGIFYATDLTGIGNILKRDWSNLVPYEIDKADCDKFAIRLYIHLCDYYGVTDIFPIWGNTDGGYHAFNLGVFRHNEGWTARLIEPQTDKIFTYEGPLGQYVPRETAMELGIKNISA